ncbi:DUF3592 domain-containing protein [Haloarcula amylolytica]|uniref:DUF3592 domain-containing protein n=1 Tax=Haloarcula amylolytica JCM 13557 TaxID=1227452 RepID=M0KWU7_9EURY|nr:DUF3592 domain-containing protein [Haloarcula amylolytica]EMA24215.1 hypothetical protein C442_04794 [Haloarcula amylolytica JCM 13557]
MANDSGLRVTGPDTLGGAVLYLVVGIAIASYGGFDYVQQTEAVRNSVEVDANITELGIETDSGTSSNPGVKYEPNVEFEYTYNGTTYTGTKLYPANIERNYERRSAAESAIDSYEQGTQTTAYVSPDEPEDAFLKNKTSNAPIIAIGLGGLFTLFAAFSVVKKL